MAGGLAVANQLEVLLAAVSAYVGAYIVLCLRIIVCTSHQGVALRFDLLFEERFKYHGARAGFFPAAVLLRLVRKS